MAIADRIEKARSLVRAVDDRIARISADTPDNLMPSLRRLRREVLLALAGLYRGNILARTGLTALAEDVAVAVVISDASTVQEYRHEGGYFQVEPDQIIAEHIDTASYCPGKY